MSIAGIAATEIRKSRPRATSAHLKAFRATKNANAPDAASNKTTLCQLAISRS